jgi:hypothetical protein
VDTPAFFDHEHALSVNYGFFDSGVGRSKQVSSSARSLSFSNRKAGVTLFFRQLYIYASRNQSSWLGDLIKADPRVLESPFETLVLAGSHDAGMFGRRVHV